MPYSSVSGVGCTPAFMAFSHPGACCAFSMLNAPVCSTALRGTCRFPGALSENRMKAGAQDIYAAATALGKVGGMHGHAWQHLNQSVQHLLMCGKIMKDCSCIPEALHRVQLFFALLPARLSCIDMCCHGILWGTWPTSHSLVWNTRASGFRALMNSASSLAVPTDTRSTCMQCLFT